MTTELSAFYQEFPVVVEIPVQWGDMDALQHVNNVVYLKWFETARIEYMNRIQFMSRLKTHNIGPILASSSVRYRVPVEYPDRVFIGASAKAFKASEMIHSYGIFSEVKNTITTVGEARMVMFDFNSQAKTVIPDDILERIESLETA
jgi:acyl-CoA thioester hydrolase